MSDSLNFFHALRPKILELITRETADCLRLAPYQVAVAPDPSTGLIGVTRADSSSLNKTKKAIQTPVIYVKYHSSLSSASVGTAVLLVYRGNLSNAYALPTF